MMFTRIGSSGIYVGWQYFYQTLQSRFRYFRAPPIILLRIWCILSSLGEPSFMSQLVIVETADARGVKRLDLLTR